MGPDHEGHAERQPRLAGFTAEGRFGAKQMLFPLIDELATTDIVSVPPRVAVRHALQKMTQHKVRSVVVEEASGGYGLLTASGVVRLRFSQLGLDTTIGDAGYHAHPYIAKGRKLLA